MKRIFLCLLACLLLSACSGAGRSPQGGTDDPVTLKLGKPYTVFGKLYVPKYDPSYNQMGKASWYGPGFHGRMTASGERFDENEITAAHPTLPIPSLARVTRLDTGEQVVVRINDRGPFAHSRLIDLSKGAAQQIGLVRDGVAQVRVEYLKDETGQYLAAHGMSIPEEWKRMAGETAVASNSPISVTDTMPRTPKPAPSSALSADERQGGFSLVSNAAAATIPKVSASAKSPAVAITRSYRIQLGSFSNQNNARNVAQSVASIKAAHIHQSMVEGKLLYRVSIGPIPDVRQAQSLLARLHSSGMQDARILVE